jgi:3-oxoacyl-[acyl-carrier protein] reductase
MRVLVTGGSRGIGKAIVDLFIYNGHSVLAPSRSELDLTQPIQLQDCEFDIVINCAGINPIKHLDSIVDNTVMQVNYLAPLQIVQQCLPYMISKQYGRIINIGSVWINTAKPARLAYSASKNALHALTKAITAEYGHFNIIANTVSPGFIQTELTLKNNTSKEILNILHNVPASRLGEPAEVAKLVYQLTVENTFVNGQNIIIDGGFSCTTY